MSNAALEEGSEEMQEVDIAEIKKLKVQELRAKLTEHGLSAKGNKPELVARLIEFYQKEAEEELGDELLDEDQLDESYEGDDTTKPATDNAKKGTATKAPTANNNTAAADDTPAAKDPPTKYKHEFRTAPILVSINIGPIPSFLMVSRLVNTTKSTSSIEDTGAGDVATKSITQMTDKERVELRAKKFGISEEEAKKMARRERFGPVDDGGLIKRAKLSDEDMEKLKARSARFGSSVAPALTSVEDDEKKKERAKKFGAIPVTSLSMESRKQMRSAKFQ